MCTRVCVSGRIWVDVDVHMSVSVYTLCVSGRVWVGVDVHMSVSVYTCMCEWACMG